MNNPTRINGLTAEEWERRCFGKTRWSDENSARAGALHSLERDDCDIKKLWVYRCPHCLGWHLTRNPQKGKDPVRLEIK